MAGSAGGALQTGQRFGAAIGTATLPGLFYVVLGATATDYRTAVAVALGAAVLAMALALVTASLAIFVGYVAATVRLLQVVSVIAMVARQTLAAEFGRPAWREITFVHQPRGEIVVM